MKVRTVVLGPKPPASTNANDGKIEIARKIQQTHLCEQDATAHYVPARLSWSRVHCLRQKESRTSRMRRSRLAASRCMPGLSTRACMARTVPEMTQTVKHPALACLNADVKMFDVIVKKN